MGVVYLCGRRLKAPDQGRHRTEERLIGRAAAHTVTGSEVQ
jgi:hypothetical protein